MDVRKIGWQGVWSGFAWLRIVTDGRLSWVQWWTFGLWHHRVSYLSAPYVQQ
jgi:hypothetical protein